MYLTNHTLTQKCVHISRIPRHTFCSQSNTSDVTRHRTVKTWRLFINLFFFFEKKNWERKEAAKILVVKQDLRQHCRRRRVLVFLFSYIYIHTFLGEWEYTHSGTHQKNYVWMFVWKKNRVDIFEKVSWRWKNSKVFDSSLLL